MNKRRFIGFVTLIVISMSFLSACTMKVDESKGSFMSAFENTLKQPFSVEFEVEYEELTMYRQLQIENQIKKTENSKILGFINKNGDRFCYVDDEEENYNLGINRINWGDGNSTEWVKTVTEYVIKSNGSLIDINSIIHTPDVKNVDTGEFISEGQDVESSTSLIINDSMNFDSILASIESIYGEIVINGYNRATSKIYRIEKEIIVTSEGIAVQSDSNTYVSPISNTVVKTTEKGASTYNWDNDNGVTINDIENVRIDVQVKKNRIVNIEYYSEKIKNLEFDKRDYTKSGRIYTVKNPSVMATTYFILDFKYD